MVMHRNINRSLVKNERLTTSVPIEHVNHHFLFHCLSTIMLQHYPHWNWQHWITIKDHSLISHFFLQINYFQPITKPKKVKIRTTLNHQKIAMGYQVCNKTLWNTFSSTNFCMQVLSFHLTLWICLTQATQWPSSTSKFKFWKVIVESKFLMLY